MHHHLAGMVQFVSEASILVESQVNPRHIHTYCTIYECIFANAFADTSCMHDDQERSKEKERGKVISVQVHLYSSTFTKHIKPVCIYTLML